MAVAQNGFFRCKTYEIHLNPMLRRILRSYFAHPLVRDLNIDATETSMLHFRIIREKSFLGQIYEQWYTSISKSFPDDITGPVLELGSGGGFFKDSISGLITSDILQVPNVDIVLDGQSLPFEHASLRGIVMIDVFHHLPDVKSFLAEAAYCVKPGGVIVMVEPWATRWSRLVYKHLHHEPFIPKAEEWIFPKGGPLSQANSALPWIVFDRDRKIFEQNFSEWRIQKIKMHTPFCYLLSGGVSLRSFMPGWLFGMWRRIENMIQPWMHSWAMFATIALVRRKA
jgi:SAM-dependent methyltransferase